MSTRLVRTCGAVTGLLLCVALLAGCAPATIQGDWVLSDGSYQPKPRTFKDGVCIRSDGTKVRYTTSGTDTLTIRKADGTSEAWRYVLSSDGNALKLTFESSGKTMNWLREGSKAAVDLHAKVDCHYIRESLKTAAMAAANVGKKTSYADVVSYAQAAGMAGEVMGVTYVTKGTTMASRCPSGGTYTVKLGDKADGFKATTVSCSVHGAR